MSVFRFLPLAAALAVGAIPTAAPAQWTNGLEAVHVVGQTTFGLTGQATTAARLKVPGGVAVDTSRGKMYVVDSGANRVLRFAYPVTANGPAAEAVFGQPDFTSSSPNNGGLGAATMNSPFGISLDPAGAIYVGDRSNNRVLVFAAAHLAATTGTAASRVFGQPDFVSAGGATTTSGLNRPDSCAFEAPDRLWIADRTNRRVIRHDNVSAKGDGAAADGVLGQTDFTTSAAAASAAGLSNPIGVAVRQGTLYIAEFGTNRVIRHANAAAKANGAAADGVLGAPDFTTAGSGNGSASTNRPIAVATDPDGRLYVAEDFNSRVIQFDAAAGKANGAAADTVLGQPGFGTSASGGGAGQMNFPNGVAVDSVNHRLIVGDANNNRVLVFQASAPLPVAVSRAAME